MKVWLVFCDMGYDGILDKFFVFDSLMKAKTKAGILNIDEIGFGKWKVKELSLD